MPVMDGHEATRAIRSEEPRGASRASRGSVGPGTESVDVGADSPAAGLGPRCVIIGLTANAFEHEQLRFREAGSDDVVAKPFRADTIYQTMASHLGVRYLYADGLPLESVTERNEVRNGQPGERRALRVLLAEDDAVNRKVAVRMLEHLGYRADVACDGAEAIEALRRELYDAVLMDVHMPEMDGLEAARRISAEWGRDRRPRIVAMTADAAQGDRERCLAAGMDDYISKPVRLAELAAALAGIESARESGRTPAGEPGEEAVDRAAPNRSTGDR
jgi:CheY-like chemotaxis protein